MGEAPCVRAGVSWRRAPGRRGGRHGRCRCATAHLPGDGEALGCGRPRRERRCECRKVPLL